MLRRGFAELDPLVAVVDMDACTACGKCLTACPYDAISMAARAAVSMAAGAAVPMTALDGREVAVISETGCKGCGGCVPVCPDDAIDLLGYTDAQVRAQIDGLLGVLVA
jgi:heterodisulfide reductase subunit A